MPSLSSVVSQVVFEGRCIVMSLAFEALETPPPNGHWSHEYIEGQVAEACGSLSIKESESTPNGRGSSFVLKECGAKGGDMRLVLEPKACTMFLSLMPC